MSQPAEGVWLPDDDLARRVDAEMEGWRQGDVAAPGFTLHLADRDQPLTPEAAEAAGHGGGPGSVFAEAEAVAVVTQTCDIVRSCSPATDNRPYAQVSPVVRLDGDSLKNAQARRSPRYAAVPGYAQDAFVDLDHCTTIEKSVLAGSDHIRGCPDDEVLRAFGLAVARHRARFAFPREVDTAMASLKKRMVNRADKDSPEGRRVDEVLEIRAAATPQWDHPDGYIIELTFIVEERHLPEVDPDVAVSEEVGALIGTKPGEVELSRRLEEPRLSVADRSALWMALADAWTALVMLDDDGRIRAVAGAVESEAVYTMARHSRSERLELDHLTRR